MNRSYNNTASAEMGLMGLLLVIGLVVVGGCMFYVYIWPSLVQTRDMLNNVVGMLPVVELARLFF